MKAKYTCPGCGLEQTQPVDLESWELGISSVECDNCGEGTHQLSGLLEGVRATSFIRSKMAVKGVETPGLQRQLEDM